jgi:hypothetical protein
MVLARSSEMSTVLTGATAAQAEDCLADIEFSAARMEGMLTRMDAATPGATQLAPSNWPLSPARVLLASVGADFALAAAGTGFEVQFPQR